MNKHRANENNVSNMSTGRKEAFENWKSKTRSSTIKILSEQREELKRKYSKAKQLGARMNKHRALINQLKGQLSRADDSEFDELRSQMEQNSVLFQQAKGELSELKPQVEHEQHLHEKQKKQVLEEFNLWWAQQERIKEEHTSEYNPSLYEGGKTFVKSTTPDPPPTAFSHTLPSDLSAKTSQSVQEFDKIAASMLNR